MDEITRFREAAVAWAAGGVAAPEAAGTARRLVTDGGVRTVVLVEGVSDRVAVEALAARRGRRLDAEGVCVVPLGGAMSVARFLDLFGPRGLGVRLAGLCDDAEEGWFRRGLERAGLGSGITRAGLEPLGFFVCVADLEEELIRALGADAVREVVAARGEARQFRVFQKQPAQRARTVEQQLRRFMGTHSGRKSLYARWLVDGLAPDRVPRPLDGLLAYV